MCKIIKVFLFVIIGFFFVPFTTLAIDGNLVPNFSLENIDGNVPMYWQSNNWGVNTASFEYPVLGVEEGKAVKVSISKYASGDAKWYSDDILVDSSKNYFFSDMYKSTTNTEVDVRYKHVDGHYSYGYVGYVQPSLEWKLYEAVITIPSDVVSIVIFHVIAGVGELLVDDMYFSTIPKDENTSPVLPPIVPEVPNVSNFSEGMVTLSFDDGWLSHYTNALPILDSVGIKGSFYIISDKVGPAPAVSVGDNLVLNPSFEEGDSSTPLGWQSNNWGINTASFEYPVLGEDGGNAAKVTISKYTSGDAKWYSDDSPVVPGGVYQFSDRYKSTVYSEVVVRYRHMAGNYSYGYVGYIPVAHDWLSYSSTLYIPDDVISISVFHVIASVGELTIDDFVLLGERPDDPELDMGTYVNIEQLLALQQSGHEIGSHTMSHVHLAEVSEAEAKKEIEISKTDLLSMGVLSIDTIVYPYGNYNSNVIEIVENAGYSGARTVEFGYNEINTDPYKVTTHAINADTKLKDILVLIDSAQKNNTWLVLMMHRIDNSGGVYASTPDTLQSVVDYIDIKNIKTVTLREGVALLD